MRVLNKRTLVIAKDVFLVYFAEFDLNYYICDYILELIDYYEIKFTAVQINYVEREKICNILSESMFFKVNKTLSPYCGVLKRSKNFFCRRKKKSSRKKITSFFF
jgi:hypothetical protein